MLSVREQEAMDKRRKELILKKKNHIESDQCANDGNCKICSDIQQELDEIGSICRGS